MFVFYTYVKATNRSNSMIKAILPFSFKTNKNSSNNYKTFSEKQKSAMLNDEVSFSGSSQKPINIDSEIAKATHLSLKEDLEIKNLYLEDANEYIESKLVTLCKKIGLQYTFRDIEEPDILSLSEVLCIPRKALRNATEDQKKLALAISDFLLGQATTALKDVKAGDWEESKRAEVYARSGYDISKELAPGSTRQADAAQAIAESLVFQGKFELAQKYLIKAFEINLTSSRENNYKNISIMEILSAIKPTEEVLPVLNQFLENEIDNLEELKTLKKGVKYYLCDSKSQDKNYWKYVASVVASVNALNKGDYDTAQSQANSAREYLDGTITSVLKREKDKSLNSYDIDNTDRPYDVRVPLRNEIKPIFCLAAAIHGKGNNPDKSIQLYRQARLIADDFSDYDVIASYIDDIRQGVGFDPQGIKKLNDFKLILN